MAANIELNKERGTYSFYSLKEVPWHELGTIVEEAKTPEEIIRIANMDYRVSLAPMFASFVPNGTKQIIQEDNGFACHLVDDNIVHIPVKGVKVNEVYSTYRTDNYNILGVVGNRYEPVQNAEAIDFIYQVCKNQNIIDPKDVIIQTAGVLGKGERIFVTAELPDYEIAKDEMKRYILFTTSHDGSGSIQACFTNVRVVCNNTLNAALKSCDNIMRFKHTKNVKSNLKAGAEMMHRSIIYNDTTKQILEAASNIKIDDTDILDFITDLQCTETQKNYIIDNGGLHNHPLDSDIISTRKKNTMLDIESFIHVGPGQNNHKGTLLWLYNGVTSYINNGINYKDNLNKFDSITTGNSYKLAQNAFNLVTSLVSKAA